MRTGTTVSAIGHGVLVALAIFGLPWFSPREREAIRVTEVSFISEAEFDAAQAAAPAEAPRAEDAPAEPPAPRPAEPAPDPPEPVVEAPEVAPEAPQVAVLEAPVEEAPAEEPARITPRIVTIEPPTAATPPRARPAPRVEPNPTPPPPEAVRPAEAPKPVVVPEPEAEVVRVEEAPAAPPEAGPAPAAEPSPAETLALETQERPRPRRGNVAPRNEAAETIMAALKQEVAKEVARRRVEPQATPAAPATEPSVTEPTAAAPATSLPVGPPLTNSEKDGLKLAVQRCWNVPAGLRDAQELKVVLAAELGADGGIINASIRLLEPSPAPDGRFQQAFEAGRRALIRCSPYSALPREKYAQWRNIEVVFNPEGMVSW